MKETETISWIFISTAFASEKEPASFEEISQVADGFNHAVPTHKRLQISIACLINYALMDKLDKKYSLHEWTKDDCNCKKQY